MSGDSSTAIGHVSRETRQRLEQYAALFDTWSARMNLVAASTRDHFWSRHVADSAQLINLKPGVRRWADLGSGGGFPGMVVAIFMSEHEGGHVDLIESNRKKASFLQTVRAACAPAATVHAQRIQSMVSALDAPQCVTARALASLPDLIAMCEPWLQQGTVGLFHKGRGFEREVAESRAHWELDLIEHGSGVEAGSVIIEIRAIGRKIRDGGAGQRPARPHASGI